MTSKLTANPLIRKFQNWQAQRRNGPPRDPPPAAAHEEWEQKAIRSLVKKLRSGKSGDRVVKELEKALETKDRNTKCVTLPRSVDGRLQVASRKGLPHFIYCRIFRFPDLKSHNQLRSVDTCANGYHAKKPAICVNPYHYDRVPDRLAVCPVMVPRSAPFAAVSELVARNSEDGTSVEMPRNAVLAADLGDLRLFSPGYPGAEEGGSGSPDSSRGSSSSDGTSSEIMWGRALGSLQSDHGYLSSTGSPTSPELSAVVPGFGSNSFPASHDGSGFSGQETSVTSSGTDVPDGPYDIDELRRCFLATTYSESSSSTDEPADGSSNSSDGPYDLDELRRVFLSTTGPAIPDSSSLGFHMPTHAVTLYADMELQQQPVAAPVQRDTPEIQEISFLEPETWCSVDYHELEHPVGEQFHATTTVLDVDGYTSPHCPNRFCLGLIPNVSRNSVAESVRRHIGRGVRLVYVGGEVFAECASSAAVFVQSVSCNEMYNMHPNTVIKLEPGVTVKIFSNWEFAKKLERSVNDGYEAVFRLIGDCAIRVSFVKGWGQAYLRTSVTSTPCWIEIHLNGPLVWLDRVLVQMGTPRTVCHSYT